MPPGVEPLAPHQRRKPRLVTFVIPRWRRAAIRGSGAAAATAG